MFSFLIHYSSPGDEVKIDVKICEELQFTEISEMIMAFSLNGVEFLKTGKM